MNFTPKLLGVFVEIYGSNEAMTFPRAALIAVIGFLTVLITLAVIALFIKALAAVFDKIESKKKFTVTEVNGETDPMLRSASGSDRVEVVGVDEPTAAIIMAIVSYQSGISPERLDFKSIRLLEDK